MTVTEDFDRVHARLAAPVRALVRADHRRIVIVGARGWIGRVALDLLAEALGAQFAERVVAVGSAPATIVLDAETTVPQLALTDLNSLEFRPTLLLHLAFLTKDKVGDMTADDYTARNRAIAATVFGATSTIGVDRLFIASSGAAASADDTAAAADVRLYGGLKREDEATAAVWAEGAPGRRVAIGRIYSLSGPHINKPETYALASFILDALAKRPIIVRAQMQVYRSYIAIRELLSVVIGELLGEAVAPVVRFDTGGEPCELAQVADTVSRIVGGRVERASISISAQNRYVGDPLNWATLTCRQGVEAVPLDQQVAETAAWLRREYCRI